MPQNHRLDRDDRPNPDDDLHGVLYNYVRPLWCNGPHVVHDAPPEVRTALDLLFKGRGPGRGRDELVKIHRVAPIDLTVAFVQVEAELPVAGTDFSYRRARYLHAVAMSGRDASQQLSPRRARSLFEDVYGEDLVDGINTAQRRLCGLEHPAQAEVVRDYFAPASHRPPPVVRTAPPSEPRVEPAIEPADLVQPFVESTPRGLALARMTPVEVESRPSEALFGSPGTASGTSPLAERASVPSSVPAPLAPLEPVEAFDRALARRSSPPRLPPIEADTRDEAAPSPSPMPSSRSQAGPLPESDATSAEPTSLSVLLRARRPGELPDLEGFGPGAAANALARPKPARRSAAEDSASPVAAASASGSATEATGAPPPPDRQPSAAQ